MHCLINNSKVGSSLMNTFNMKYAKQWAKTSDHKMAKLIKRSWFAIKSFEIPQVPIIFSVLYVLHITLKQVFSDFTRIFYYTAIFKTRVNNQPKRLYLYGGLPVVIGSLEITMGDDVRLAAMTTISGRTVGNYRPSLVIGNNVGIAWRTSISVGTTVILGDNVRIAGDCFLAGYPGHPVDAKERAKGKPDTENQIGDIILENDVWLGTGVKVMPGVTIGEGSIVAAGSVVTKDLPKHVLAAGVPACIVKSL